MREELLAHLTEIYEEELASTRNPAVALDAAAKRFGDPCELAGELSNALPWMERVGFLTERWFGWCAPESVARYLFRQARLSFVALAIVVAIVATVIGLQGGWEQSTWQAIRPAAATLLLVPLAQFLLGILYFKMRGAMFGAKSAARVVITDCLIATVVLVNSVGFIAIATWDKTRTLELVPAACIAAFAAAIAYPFLVRLRGRTEIADTMWALITLTDTAD